MLVLLRTRGVAVRLAAVLLSAVPIGMLPLALVVDGLDRSGSSAVAGALAASLAIGSGLGVLAQGALLVRVRAALLLPLCGVVGVAASTVVATSAPSGGGLALASIAAAVTGATIPAVTTSVRGRLVELLPEGGQRVSAYAALNVLFQAGLAAGPVAAALLAAAGAARAAAPVAAVLGLVAAVVVALVDRAAPAPSALRVPMTDLQPPRRGLLVLLGVALAAGVGAGTLQVVVPSATIGAPVLAGAAFAALAIGEVLGALVAASRVGPASARSALRAGLAAMSAMYLVAVSGVPGAAVVPVTGSCGRTSSRPPSRHRSP